MRSTIATIMGLLAACAPLPMTAQAPPQDLGAASFEDLMNMEVTSVSKKEEKLSKTPAAVYVISKEDIRRSGATNIPDLLRMVPGVEVAQVDANQWAVSIRGFNAVYSNKVLVLIDGRSIFVDSFSGVYWDQMQTPLEDIERIEVIRGPGGTIWGANAVNGVINIITKNAADTKGALVRAESGTRENAGGLAQYGGDAGSNGAWRAYAGYSNNLNSRFPGGARAFDAWHAGQAGFRSDWALSSTDTFSVQGEFLTSAGGGTSSVVDQTSLERLQVNQPVENTSGDVLASWTHTLANGSELSFRFYDTAMHRDNVGLRIGNNTADLELEHHITVGSRHDIVWGLDLRLLNDSVTPEASYALRLSNPVRADLLYTAFMQDEIRVTPSVSFTVGSKVEHNDFTGFQFEPGAQLLWKASDRHTFWASAAHAIREPDHTDDAVEYNEGLTTIPGVGQALVTLSGNTHLEAERLNDYEIGYRGQVRQGLSFDITGFASFYGRLTTFDLGTPYLGNAAGMPILILLTTYGNGGRAQSYGIEFFAHWNVNHRLELSPGFSTIHITTQDAPGIQDFYVPGIPGTSPHYQPQVRSLVNIRRNLEWDSSVKYVSTLTWLSVPGYLRIDSRLGWKFGERGEISLVGQNLSSGRHIEFVDFAQNFLSTEVARSVSAKITWRF